MVKKQNIAVWTHYDLDGCVSLLTIKWAFPKAKIECKTSQPHQFYDEFSTWKESNDLSVYDKIIIIDLDVGSSYGIIDLPNVLVIDHHKTHVEALATKTVEHAKTVVIEYTSAARLAYRVFKKLNNIEFTDAQKKLILLCDDYDCGACKLPHSKDLNAIFWNINNKFESFQKMFYNGFDGWNEQQSNIIGIYKRSIQKIRDNTTFYEGEIKIGGTSRRVVAAFASTYINDVANVLIEDHKADLAIVINSSSMHVSLRRGEGKTAEGLDVSAVAEKLCDGGGHEYAAGGKATDAFQALTKKLHPIRS